MKKIREFISTPRRIAGVLLSVILLTAILLTGSMIVGFWITLWSVLGCATLIGVIYLIIWLLFD